MRSIGKFIGHGCTSTLYSEYDDPQNALENHHAHVSNSEIGRGSHKTRGQMNVVHAFPNYYNLSFIRSNIYTDISQHNSVLLTSLKARIQF